MINSNTRENFIQQFKNLSHPNQEIRNHANIYIMRLIESQEAWTIAKQLLDQDNQEYKFFGAQMLYRKVDSSFQSINIEWKQQLKSYVFTYFYQHCPKLSKPVLSKITSTAAIIASTLYLDRWKNFLQDLSNLMKTSAYHLKGGLEILENITQQIRNLRNQSYSYRELIKNEFLKNQQFLFNIFNSVFETQDYSCIEKNLICIQSWTNFSLPIMKDTRLIKNIIENSLKSILFFNTSCEILVNALKHQSTNNFTTIDSPIIKKEQLTQIQFNNLILIIKFILTNKLNLYDSQTVQKSEFYKIYGHLVKELLLNYPWIVAENIIEVGIPLFDIMISTLNHKSINVSFCGLQFWNLIYSQLKKVISQKLDEFVQFYYIKVYQSLLQKTKLKIIQDQLLEEQQVVQYIYQQDEETTNEQKYNSKITFKQYRQQAISLYQVIYRALFDRGASEGIKKYFNYVIELLKSPISLIDREARIELGLFVTKSSLQNSNNESYLFYLQNIITFTTSLHDISNVVKMQIFKLYNDCAPEIKKLSLFSTVLPYVLQYINDQKIGQHAGYCFFNLMISIKVHNDINLIENLFKFYIEHFEKIENEVLMSKFLEGFLSFLLKIQKFESLDNYIKIFLQISTQKFNRYLHQQKKIKLLRCLKELRIIFLHFETNRKNYHAVLATYFVKFADLNLNYLQKAMEYCYQIDIKYSQINQLGLIQNIYKSIVKLISGFSLDTIYKLLNLSMKFLVKNISQYCNLLGILIFTLQQICLRKLNQQQMILFDSWLLQNYNQFNNFYLKQLFTNSDPDVIKNFFKVQEQILFYKQEFFFKYQLRQQILRIALQNIAFISQSYMTKTILLFLCKYVYSFNWEIYYNYNRILHIVFTNIPRIQTNNNSTIYKIIFRICNYFVHNNLNYQHISLQNIFFQLLFNCGLQNISEANLKLLAMALQYYILVNNQQLFKGSIMDIHSLYKGCYGSNIFMQIEMRLQLARKQNKTKKN